MGTVTERGVRLLDRELVHRLNTVLRLKEGQEVLVCEGAGKVTRIRIVRVEKKEIRGDLVETWQEESIGPRITLFQALPKMPSKLEEVLVRCTELGVTRFVPVLSARTEARDVKNRARLETLLQGAAEQSEAAELPLLEEVMSWKEALGYEGVQVVADSYRSEPLLRDVASEVRGAEDVGIYIGPEGGFTEEEIRMAEEAGALCVSLGSRILRTETAGMAVVSAIRMG